ncbi:DNA-binding protein HU-beta [Metamycoplasma subdolum]|uniref:DNA-binding protein HU-beta n=1 Tax=Metamycoplasma subdolum TaxID=92407 RepID=A0A3L9ZXL4_9BACT|nr:HU family DNA-binding protein [Metamycoplasma subdolum]RMA77453.1 DNA-binding protein HU-beta [Metamycoplasma subdolum]WPB50318.1 HU family DNA-binding protein [Metamycoplasma subdolum]
MNKREMIVRTSEKLDVPQVMVEAIWDQCEKEIIETLASGEKVAISGFGTFTINQKDEKQRINYFTKERIIVPAKTEPKFKFSDVFKAQINRY